MVGLRASERWYYASLIGGPKIVVIPISAGGYPHADLLLMPLKFLGRGPSGTMHVGLRNAAWAGFSGVLAVRF